MPIERVSYCRGLDSEKTYILANQAPQAMADKYDGPFILLALALYPVCTAAYAHRIVLLSIRRERRQKIPRVVPNPTLRYHAPPVRHACIVSECKDACCRELGREEGFRPRLGRIASGPGLLAVASQAVDKDNAGQRWSSAVII
jgi:hypothetical protein